MPPSPRRRPAASAPAPASRLRLLLALLAVAGVVALVLTQRGGDDDRGALPPAGTVAGAADPLAFEQGRADEYAARAARGTAHPLYTRSPGGAVATAERVERLRPLIDAAARDGGIDPATLEAIVLLESAGRPDALSSTDLSGAVGLTQILAETGSGLLGMRVDVAASTRLTRRLRQAQARGDRRAAARLEARRRAVDERFDPRKALAGTVRYLDFAKRELGRDDLAVVSYHMGVGNLQRAIAAYRADGGGDATPSYAQLFFGSSPRSHAAAWEILAGFGDESALYYWKVLAARELLALHRDEPERLRQLAVLQTQKGSSENVLHPPDGGEAFADPDALRAAYADGTLRRLPANAAALGLRIDRQMGELAPRLGQPKALYRGLRPGALRLLVALADGVRRISGERAPLIVTSTVRDAGYQRRLADGNGEATRNFSVHTTGWSFDLLRRYASARQARAFQFMLDRLQALNLIAWVREPAAIHVTVAGDADRFLSAAGGGG